jgi:hypothetical protein
MSLVSLVAWFACAAALLPLALVLLNLRALQPLPPGRSSRLVSVLIPARNEAANIGRAIDSVLASRNAVFELLVLDDDSTDATAGIVAVRACDDVRVRLLSGRSHDPGLWGKPQACAELAAAARGEVLLFMDADVRLEPDALARIATRLEQGEAALLSGIPRQQTPGLAEQLIVPLIHFVLLGFLPVAAMRRSREPAFGVACGQLLAVRRKAYIDAGGHGRIADRIHDGMALARALRAAGYLTDLADFSDLASCRMYRSAVDVIAGFAKNAHEGLGSRRGIVPWTVLLLAGQSAWVLLLPAAAAGAAPLLPTLLAAIAALAARLLLDLRFGTVGTGTLLHPAGVFGLVAIQWYALLRRALGRPVAWKARVPDTGGGGSAPRPVA